MVVEKNDKMKIESPKDYFEYVIFYNFEKYKLKPGFLPTAFNLSNSLLNMFDWMWHTYECRLGDDIFLKKDYRKYVHHTCPSFEYISDLANASKHLSLNRASTKMTSISDATAAESKFGEGGFGVGKFGRGAVIINSGGYSIDFERVAIEVYEFWRAELNRVGE